MKPQRDCINVSVRIRPTLNEDDSKASSLQIISKEPPVLLVLDRSQTYHFDNIFPEDADQEKVYNNAVKPMVEYVKMGYNCTVFAYGQTGTGKTYTMGSGSQKPANSYDTGIIPRALEQLLNEQQINSDQELEIFISFSEIYNEKVFDLLQPEKKTPLPVSGFVVQGLSLKNIRNVQEAKELLELGNKNRHVGETRQNSNSSRSHAIFTVYYTRKTSCEEIAGKLNLVDLAGSESVRKTGSKGNTFQEGININKGLLSIGQVISALSMKSSYIPYRQSMITSILQGSLNVDNYISLIACLSGNPDDITETLQTLDFAQRVKRVRNKPEVNQVIAKYKKDNPGSLGFVRTPMKRVNGTPMKAGGCKKMTLPPLPLIDESTQSQISNVDNTKSQFSIDISSVSSRISPRTDISQQTLSPVIRKYITKMEVSIMDRLESVIKSTLRRPTRASLLAEKAQVEINKENTSSIPWNKIQHEVSKLVKNEIAQMSAKTVRATSSPLEEKNKDNARRILLYNSPDNLDPAGSGVTSTVDQPEDHNLFKVPQLPMQKKIRDRRSKLSISPIENEMPKLTPRRSTRLSLKRINQSTNNNSSLDMSEVSFDSRMNSRCSNISITKKRTSIYGNSIDLDKSAYRREFPDNESDFETSEKGSQNHTKNNHKYVNSNVAYSRRSLRIAQKLNVSDMASPPIQQSNKIGYSLVMTPAKKLLKKHKDKNSPYTAHSKTVLSVLNKGSLREVEKLHMIGPKTAEQILLYRRLKGSFTEIDDLTNIPGWGTKKYEKFIALNFLRKD